MSLQALLNPPKTDVVSKWDAFLENDNQEAKGIEQMTMALSAMEQLDALFASVDQVMEITDPAHAELALSAIFADKNYASLRPSLESVESEDKQGLVAKLIEGAKSIIKALCVGLATFIAGIFDRSAKLNSKAAAFYGKVKNLKGKPIAKTVTLSGAATVLTMGGKFDPTKLSSSTEKELADNLAFLKASYQKEDADPEAMVKEIDFSYKDNVEKDPMEVDAIDADIISAWAKLLATDTDAFRGSRKTADNFVKVDLGGRIAALEKIKAVSTEARADVEKLKATSAALSKALKLSFSNVMTKNTGRLTALVTFAKNIEAEA